MVIRTLKMFIKALFCVIVYMSQILSDFYFFPVLFLPVTLSIIFSLFVYLLNSAERQFFCFVFLS